MAGFALSTEGAWVAIKNALVYATQTAFRYEDNIQNLRIWNSTVGQGVTRAFQAAASGSSGLDVRNLLVLGSLPSEAAGPSNMAVSAAAFVDVARGDYRLASNSPAIDAGTTIQGVSDDLAGVPRPQGGSYDSGAYEFDYRAGNRPPSIAISSPVPGATFVAPASLTITAAASDPDGYVAEVSFYANGTLLARDVTPPFVVTAAGALAGTYVLTATAMDDAAGTATSAPVQIVITSSAPQPVPSWTLAATPATIVPGEASVLSFTTTTADAHNIFVNGQRPGYTCTASACSGSLIVRPSATTTYTLSAINAAGVPYPPLQTAVTVAVDTPAWSLSAAPSTVRPGEPTVLSFSTTTADFHNVFINGTRPTLRCTATACSGSLTVTPTTSTTYVLTSTDARGVPYPALSTRVTVTAPQ
jgi:hypothetical protein